MCRQPATTAAFDFDLCLLTWLYQRDTAGTVLATPCWRSAGYAVLAQCWRSAHCWLHCAGTVLAVAQCLCLSQFCRTGWTYKADFWHKSVL